MICVWSIQEKGMRPYRQTSRRPTKCAWASQSLLCAQMPILLKSVNFSVINVGLHVVFSREGDAAIPIDLAQTDKMPLGPLNSFCAPKCPFY